MSESGHFIVDSQGEAEYWKTERNRRKSRGTVVMRYGNVVLPLGTTPLTHEQIGDAKYFGEPNGRVISTETGEAVVHGDGRNQFAFPAVDEAIADYEAKSHPEEQ